MVTWLQVLVEKLQEALVPNEANTVEMDSLYTYCKAKKTGSSNHCQSHNLLYSEAGEPKRSSTE